MSSAIGASRAGESRLTLRTLTIVVAFAIFQVLVHALVARGFAGRSLLWIALLPQASAYGFLFWFFGRTLLPGREALVTSLARMVHGELPAEIERYTRRVTAFWCWVFAAMFAASPVLFVFARLETWSLLANVLNFPLIAVAFVGEYAWRILRYPGFSHASLAGTVREFWRYCSASRVD